MKFVCLTNPTHHASDRYTEFFEVCDELLIICDQVQAALNERRIESEGLSDYQLILIVNIPKAINSILSVCRLCDAGLCEDAKTIARKLLEMSANIEHISEDDTEMANRAARFVNHFYVQIHDLLRKAQKHPERLPAELTRGFLDQKSIADEGYERVKALYKLKQGEVDSAFTRHWDGSNLSELLGPDDIVIYTLYCYATHFSPTDRHTYFRSDEAQVTGGIDIKEVPYVLHVACIWTLRILYCVEREFQVGVHVRLTEIDRKARELGNRLGMSS